MKSDLRSQRDLLDDLRDLDLFYKSVGEVTKDGNSNVAEYKSEVCDENRKCSDLLTDHFHLSIDKLPCAQPMTYSKHIKINTRMFDFQSLIDPA